MLTSEYRNISLSKVWGGVGWGGVVPSLQLLLPGSGDARFLPGAEVKVRRPKELDDVIVVDAERVGSVVVVDSVSVVEKSTIRFLIFPDVVLRNKLDPD